MSTPYTYEERERKRGRGILPIPFALHTLATFRKIYLARALKISSTLEVAKERGSRPAISERPLIALPHLPGREANKLWLFHTALVNFFVSKG